MTGLAVAALAVVGVGAALQVARRAAARWWARVAAVANQRPANPTPPVPRIPADGYPQILPAGEAGRHGRSGCSCRPLLGVQVTPAGDPVAVLLHQPLASGPPAAR
jgi:hypothetical protein